MLTQTKISKVSNPWWGHDPSDKQWFGLYGYEDCPDLFYGGAAGPGKTSFLLMAAVQYVHYPHYRALILRKTYADLSLPDAIMDRAISWWDGVEGAKFNNQEKACYFPSGAKITFGYLASARDHLRYQGAAVHFVGIDEASQIPSRQLEYLHSRIRRAIGDPIPLRYRLASNPGDVSHDWLKDTYVNGADGHSVVYLPGLMTDNPGLDVEEYRKQLAHLDPVTRKQLEEGDWDVQLSGGVLDVTALKYFTSGEFGQRVRYWDFAATEQKEGVDPDWTSGVLMGVEDGAYQVHDVQRFRVGPAEVEVRVKAQAQIDGPNVPVRIEQEPGSAGVIAMDHYARHVLQGRDFRGVRSTGSKSERARPLSAAISNGLVSLRSEAPWVRDLTNEMRSFPVGTHDDQVDAMSGAMTALTQQDRIQSVLPGSLLQLCVDAYRKYEREIGRIIASERPFVGFRIAETNTDRTSMVTRTGPAIIAVEQWDETYTATLERVDRHCREVGALALYYDAGGSGASIRTNLRQVWRERQLPQHPVFSAPTHWNASMRVTSISQGTYQWRLYADAAFSGLGTLYLDMRANDDDQDFIQNVALTKAGADSYWASEAYAEADFPFRVLFSRSERTRIRIRKADNTLSDSIIHLIPIDDVREALVDEGDVTGAGRESVEGAVYSSSGSSGAGGWAFSRLHLSR